MVEKMTIRDLVAHYYDKVVICNGLSAAYEEIYSGHVKGIPDDLLDKEMIGFGALGFCEIHISAKV